MSPLLVHEIAEETADTISISTGIELTPIESTLRQLLLDVGSHIDSNPESSNTQSQVQLPDDLAKEKLTLRFTGGWVRDKLLGVDSHDIDVAINKMTGFQFGLRLKEYLEIPGNAAKYGLEGVGTSQSAGATDKSKTVGGLHKIEANPEKSKHLETVTTKIFGLDIDLVNLRKETYTVDSRNPQMEFGTPEEDALRRDATINAMFYNINTSSIEDFTGRGRQDLQAKTLRTPLDPYQTFEDDPLRVLRLIRFASRLGYTIDQQALDAMRENEIKDALKRKISRERIGVEMEKALRGPGPQIALSLISDVGLYETVFLDPTISSTEHYQPDLEGWRATIDCLQEVIDSDGALLEIVDRDPEDRFLAWQLAALIPYRDAPQPGPSEVGRRLPPPTASAVAREGLKSTNKVCDVVTAAVWNQEEITGLVDKFYQQKRRPDKQVAGQDAAARDVLGMAIRQWGSGWRSQVVYAMLVEVANDSDAATDIQRKYAAFVQHISDISVLEAYNFKPLMDGKTLAKALNTSPGPWMKDALDVVMAYQLRNPDTANAEDAVAEVEAIRQGSRYYHCRGELTSALVHHFLKLTIRPLFIKAKPSSVTDTGRKNTTTVLPKKVTVESMDDTVTKPWKSGPDGQTALDLLRWCVLALDETLVESVWHLIVPPLLTLVDDWEARYKTIGAELVGGLLKATPPSLLEKTGLGEVFEDAIMPCLTYLPTITPEDESIRLLDVVYPTLVTLGNVRYPNSSRTPNVKSSDPTGYSHPRIKFLDTIIRKGIIYGYTHCSSVYPRITSTLLKHLVPVIENLGMDSVKHLKYLLPMISETLSHPLLSTGAYRIETLVSANKALQAIILNGWPRMAVHRGEVLKGPTLCWVKIKGESGESVERLRSELKETVQMLKVAIGTEADFQSDCKLLIKADARVGGLLVD